MCCSHIVISSMTAFWNEKERDTFICATSCNQQQNINIYKATTQISARTKSTSFWGPHFFLLAQHSAVVCQLGRAWEGMALAEHAPTCWIPVIQVHGGGASTWHQRYPTLPHQRLTKSINRLTIHASQEAFTEWLKSLACHLIWKPTTGNMPTYDDLNYKN